MKLPLFKSLLGILLLFFTNFGFAQTPLDERDSQIDLHLTADYVHIKTYGAYVTGGLLGEFHYTEHVSALHPISFGANYFELGLGTLFATLRLWTLGNDDKTLGQMIGMFLVMITSAESMGYHLKLGENLQFIPYYSLCRFRTLDSDGGELSASLGGMFRIHLSDRWHLNLSGEYSQFYTTRNLSAMEGGVSFAYAFR